jgi:predicted nucleic acid-binding protein
MIVERYTFDTNILFYSLDASDDAKHKLARNLIGLAGPHRALLLLQTLGELCSATSKKRPALFAEAQSFVVATANFLPVVPASLEDVMEASALQQQHRLQFWDAMLCATARRAGCTLLLSEDLQDGRTLDGLTIRNPFRLAATELDKLLV